MPARQGALREDKAVEGILPGVKGPELCEYPVEEPGEGSGAAHLITPRQKMVRQAGIHARLEHR